MYRRILKRHGLRLFLLFMLFIPCSEAVKAQEFNTSYYDSLYTYSHGGLGHFVKTKYSKTDDVLDVSFSMYISLSWDNLRFEVLVSEDKPFKELAKIIEKSSANHEFDKKSVKIYLQNGEILTDDRAEVETDRVPEKDGYVSFDLNIASLKSNVRSISDNDKRLENNCYLLSHYPIDRIEVEGCIVDITGSDSHECFRDMLAILKIVKKASGNNNASSSSVSSSTTSVSKGPIHYIDPPKSSHLGYISSNIKKWKICRTGCVTEMGAGVAVMKTWGYSYTGNTPMELKNKLDEIARSNGNIVDVNITEKGSYVIIFDSYGYSVRGDYPQSFVDALSEINNKKDAILSACFNDKGQWAIVTKSFCVHSADEVGDFVKKATTKYGKVLHVYLSNEGMVACCVRGVYYHYIPSNLAKKLKQLKFKPKVVKFTDNGLFLVTDGISQYDYFM